MAPRHRSTAALVDQIGALADAAYRLLGTATAIQAAGLTSEAFDAGTADLARAVGHLDKAHWRAEALMRREGQP